MFTARPAFLFPYLALLAVFFFAGKGKFYPIFSYFKQAVSIL